MSIQKGTSYVIANFTQLMLNAIRQLKDVFVFIVKASRLQNEDFYFW
jgi:hypothetical protein